MHLLLPLLSSHVREPGVTGPPGAMTADLEAERLGQRRKEGSTWNLVRTRRPGQEFNEWKSVLPVGKPVWLRGKDTNL